MFSHGPDSLVDFIAFDFLFWKLTHRKIDVNPRQCEILVQKDFLMVCILQKIAEFLQSLEFFCTNLYNIFSKIFVINTIKLIFIPQVENARITYNCQFYPHDENSGSNLWTDLITDGNLDNKECNLSPIKIKKALRNKLAIAVCVQIKVPAHSKDRIEFALVWNMPNVSFVNNQKKYKKFYTRYFSDENPDCAKEIACYSLHSWKSWEKELSEFRQPIIQDQSLPKWYKIVLFNELYFISDGGTVWFDIKNDPNCKHQVVREYGRFAYLEGQEYRMYNTYDVHFNANFALLQLWPKLQLSLQYEFADTIPMESKNDVKFLIDGKYAKQKSKNSLPHDIGDPYREPWSVLNAYNSHDTRDWKDLNLKFILTVYRDYFYLKDNEYLEYMWPYIKLLMITVQSQDHDGD
ncbi:non-lysosomal glucosylceramidase, partial [Brachionus plicatilis]